MSKRPMVAPFDLLTCLLLIFVILALTEKPAKPTIVTEGQLAVTDSWRAGSNNDVDLYVRDPNGRVIYFANQSAGLVHLEQDDLGTDVSGTVLLPDGRQVVTKYNGERAIIRGVVPGEYTVNVHMYQRSDKFPRETPVQVQLWFLRGQDTPLLSQRIVLGGTGSEETAFRFTLDTQGHMTSHNRLQVSLVGDPETG